VLMVRNHYQTDMTQSHSLSLTNWLHGALWYTQANKYISRDISCTI
jgi:hypothetical protein